MAVRADLLSYGERDRTSDDDVGSLPRVSDAVWYTLAYNAQPIAFITCT